MTAYLIGTGVCLPDRIVSNDELGISFGIDPETIFKKTGIRHRRWAGSGTKTSDLAGLALAAAVQDAELSGSNLEYVIFGTMTPDRFIPGGSTRLQSALNLPQIPCLEIRNACCNVLFGLQLGSSLINTRSFKKVGLACADVQSRYLSQDPSNASLSILFGDAGSAIILSDTPNEKALKLVDVLIRSDGEHVDALGIRAPGTEFPNPNMEDFYPSMDGRIVIAEALKNLCDVSTDLLARNNLSIKDDVSWIVPHQANANLFREIARRLDFPLERIVSVISDSGNTSSASLGLALHELRNSSRLRSGDRILLPTFGAGFSWGAAIAEAL